MVRADQCDLLCLDLEKGRGAPHLRALRDAGLAHSRREHRIVYYALTSEGRELLTAVTIGAVVAS